MSMFTSWYAATDEEVELLLDGAGESEPTLLGAVAELELLALGELLGTPYEPALVGELESTVLRVNAPFLHALVAIDDVPGVVDRWRTAAEHLAEVDEIELADTLRDMCRCARAGLEGPGVLSLSAG